MRWVMRLSIVDGSESTSPVVDAASTRLARNSGLPPDRPARRSRSRRTEAAARCGPGELAGVLVLEPLEPDHRRPRHPRRDLVAAHEQAHQPPAILDLAGDGRQQLRRRVVDPLRVVDDDERRAVEDAVDHRGRRAPQTGAAELLGELVGLACRRRRGAEHGGQQRQPRQLVRGDGGDPGAATLRPLRWVRRRDRTRRAGRASCAPASRERPRSTRRRRGSAPPAPGGCAAARRAAGTCRSPVRRAARGRIRGRRPPRRRPARAWRARAGARRTGGRGARRVPCVRRPGRPPRPRRGRRGS